MKTSAITIVILFYGARSKINLVLSDLFHYFGISKASEREWFGESPHLVIDPGPAGVN